MVERAPGQTWTQPKVEAIPSGGTAGEQEGEEDGATRVLAFNHGYARMVVPEHMYPSLSPAPLTGSMSHCWSGPPSIHTMTVFHTTATLCSQALAYICIFHVCIVDVDELCRPIVAALCAWIVCHLRLPYRLHL
eukprot:COSAG05_NODE_343_length_11025_cov_14.803313_2_plen_134_part_00